MVIFNYRVAPGTDLAGYTAARYPANFFAGYPAMRQTEPDIRPDTGSQQNIGSGQPDIQCNPIFNLFDIILYKKKKI